MKITIKIKYSSGEEATYLAGLPEWANVRLENPFSV